ncbi:hypothetical protein VPH35_123154 [Triticum aestivum]
METTTAVRNTSRRRASELQVTVSSSCMPSKSGVMDCLIYRVGLRRPSKPTEVVPRCCLCLPAPLLQTTRTTQRLDGCCCSSTTFSGSEKFILARGETSAGGVLATITFCYAV